MIRENDGRVLGGMQSGVRRCCFLWEGCLGVLFLGDAAAAFLRVDCFSALFGGCC